jgi:cytochrome P450
MRLGDINLLDVNLFAESREYAVFQRLRAEAPVYFHSEPDGPGFHVVTRYDDVIGVVRNPLLYASGMGTQIVNRRAEGYGASSVHNSDPPYHTYLRNLVLPSFAPSALRRIEPKVRDTVNRLFDECPRGEAFDFVDSYAVKLPMMVIGAILGVPEDDQPQMVNWANTISDVRATDRQQAQAREELFNFFRRLVAQKRANPGDDLATVLAQSKIEGRALNEDELDAYFVVLSAAGNETTRFLVSGGLEQMCFNPENMPVLRDSPELIPAAVEEMVRWVSPVMQMRRTATADAEIAGTPINKGDKVVVYFASANRDERKFDDPEAFVPTRKQVPHLGFGNGAHFCIGAHLARLEARIFFETLFEKVSEVRLAGKGERLPSYIFHGHVRLPVIWN